MFDEVRMLNQSDVDAFERFMAPRTAQAYFLHANARDSAFQNEGKHGQGDYAGAFRDGELVGVQALFNGYGALWMCATDMESIGPVSHVLKQFWQARDNPQPVQCVSGIRDMAWATCKAWGIGPDMLNQPEWEWLFELDLAQMQEPSGLEQDARVLRLAEPRDEEQIISWRIAYYIEALFESPLNPGLEERARREFKRRLGKSLYVLESEGKIVSMGGIVQDVPGVAWIGPMWTPPEMRGRGHAQTLLAKMLQLQKAQGAGQAVLIAERPDAIACYEKLGFRKTADWLLALLKSPLTPEHLKG